MRFTLKVVKGSGGASMLDLDAADAALASAEAQRRGYTVLSARSARLHLRLRNARFPLVLFAQELHALLEAGLPLLEALESLAERNGDAADALDAVIRALREGKSFSDALADRPETFPPFFVATVRASE